MPSILLCHGIERLPLLQDPTLPIPAPVRCGKRFGFPYRSPVIQVSLYFFPHYFRQYNPSYRKAAKSGRPAPGSPDFDKLNAVTMSYISRCLFVGCCLHPSLAQARPIWHLWAVSWALGSYTLCLSSTSTFAECFPVNSTMMTPPTRPPCAPQRKWIIKSEGRSYSFGCLQWQLIKICCSRKPSEKAAYMATKPGYLSSDGEEETPKPKKTPK